MRKPLALLLLLAAALTLSAAETMRYILKRGESSHAVLGGNINVNNIDKLLNRFDGDYLWAKIDGKEYLIRDRNVMNEAARAFVHVEANQAEYHALERRMRPIERKHDQLEETIDDLGDGLSDHPERYSETEERNIELQIRRLEEQMKPLEAQLRELEREEERLDQKQETLEEAAEKQLEQIIRKAIRSGAAKPL